MKLKSFGCSFIYGSDLSDEIIVPGSHASELSWPALLAKQINFDYECYARAGAGNLYILEQVLINAASSQQDLFVIGWTWIDRFDYTDTTDNWKTILPVDTTEADFYYRNFQYSTRPAISLLFYRWPLDLLLFCYRR
jgi:hypothetical protein